MRLGFATSSGKGRREKNDGNQRALRTFALPEPIHKPRVCGPCSPSREAMQKSFWEAESLRTKRSRYSIDLRCFSRTSEPLTSFRHALALRQWF